MAEPIRDVEPEFYTAAQLEMKTGITANTWLYYAWAGKGPASLKIGRRRVWRKAVVEQWLLEQEREQA